MDLQTRIKLINSYLDYEELLSMYMSSLGMAEMVRGEYEHVWNPSERIFDNRRVLDSLDRDL